MGTPRPRDTTPPPDTAPAPGVLPAPDTLPAPGVLPAPDTAQRRARLAVLAVFVAHGLVIGSWTARVPDVKDHLALGDARWGTLSMASTVGSPLAALLSAWIINRVGARRLSRVGLVLLLLCSPCMSLAPTAALLTTAMAVWGIANSLLQAPVNSAGVVVERSYRRPIMNSFHAGWSIGALTGGLLGALAARAGTSPGQQLVATNLALAVLLGVTTRWMPPDETGTERHRPGLRLTRQVVLLGAITFFCSLAESTASGWAGIYLHETLGTGADLAALAYACFVASMVVGRVAGDRLLHRVGRRRFLRLMPLLATAGTLGGLAGGTPASACAGFVVTGFGLACIMPTALGITGNQPGLPAGQALATVSLLTWPAFLLGPPVVGGISQVTSPRVGLLVVALSACVITVLARLVRFPDPHDAAPPPVDGPGVQDAR